MEREEFDLPPDYKPENEELIQWAKDMVYSVITMPAPPDIGVLSRHDLQQVIPPMMAMMALLGVKTSAYDMVIALATERAELLEDMERHTEEQDLEKFKAEFGERLEDLGSEPA